MKKATLKTIVDYIQKNGVLTELKDELTAELNKGAEEKAAKAAEYEAVKDTIMSNLDYAPATAKELYDACAKDLPDGFTQGKFNYALTHLWQDEIVVVKGAPNQYRRA